MSVLTISSRDRRTLVLGSLFIGSILGVGKGLPALRRWESSRVQAALDVHDRLAAASRGDVTLKEVRDSAAARAKRLDTLQSRMIWATSAEGAAAQLATLAEKIANDQGMDVQTVTLNPDSVVRAGFVRASIRISAETDVTGLLDFLFEMETRRTPIVVREVTVSQPDVLGPQNRAEALRVDVVLQTLAALKPASPRPVATREPSR